MDIDSDGPSHDGNIKEVINQQIEDDLAARQAKQAKQVVKLADADKNKTLEETKPASTSPLVSLVP